MKFKKVALMEIAAIAVCSVLNVSAAEKPSGGYANALKEGGKENLIIDVEAYKAAYSDLAEAFGDDLDAYIEHYLTIGVYEGRTKGVLFDPLAYAEAYGDVKAAFGNDISAIVNHYLTFGIVENRTEGTANGYADIETAEKNSGVVRRTIQPERYAANTAGSSNNMAAASYVSYESAPAAANAANSVGAVNGGSSAAASGSNTAAAAGGSNNAPSGAGGSVSISQNYHHTTSIYDDDNTTLLRVEYYDENNKLSQFSSVTNFDSSTNSYTEEIYSYDEENDVIVLDRTDIYVNGSLSSSETP